MPTIARSVVMLALALVVSAGCAATRNAYYNAWESMGYAKRERLVDNVKKAREEQQEAKQQFTTALEQFKAVTKYDGGSLEKAYNTLKKQYDNSASQAEEVREKIKAVKNVGSALFTEWQGEVKQIKNDDALQRQSQQLLDNTKKQYEQLVVRMDSAAATMDPVLEKFNNRVLFLKANLNAQAIASLEGTAADLGKDIDKLIAEMEKSIAEADEFIAQMNTGK
jgi:hypothetical protein